MKLNMIYFSFFISLIGFNLAYGTKHKDNNSDEKKVLETRYDCLEEVEKKLPMIVGYRNRALKPIQPSESTFKFIPFEARNHTSDNNKN